MPTPFSIQSFGSYSLRSWRPLLELLEDRTLLSASVLSLDVDDNGSVDPLSDGLLVLRHLFGFAGPALVQDALGAGARRTDPAAIQAFLNQGLNSVLDGDGNQETGPLTDGLLTLRYLFGFNDQALIQDALGEGSTRTAGQIVSHFQSYDPSIPESNAPTITSGLMHDTGRSSSDAITFDPAALLCVQDLTRLVSFTAGLDDLPLENHVDLTAELGSADQVQLSRPRLEELFGILNDGSHVLHLRATDSWGNLQTSDFTFTLDTQAPSLPGVVDLALTSDTGMRGDQTTAVARVTLIGQAEAGSFVNIVNTAVSSLVNTAGSFQLPGVGLNLGSNDLTLQSEDLAGNASATRSVTFTRVEEAQTQDPVLLWNQALLNAISLDATPPPVAARAMALVSTAVYDVVALLEGTAPYLVSLPAPSRASPEAAVAGAAHQVLTYLFPGQLTRLANFDAVLTQVLADLPDDSATTEGLAFGRQVGDAVIALRQGDGWNTFVDYIPGNSVGDWVPTAPMYEVALLPQWAQLTPFALTSGDQFRPAPPPEVGSPEYITALEEVQSLGRFDSTMRTTDQTQIAKFWADGKGTYTPPGHWNQIAAELAAAQGNSLSENARLFALLNVALADAAVAAWDAKYYYNFWRPITAIRAAPPPPTGGGGQGGGDATWLPLLVTPNFPTYTSGHSTFSGAAEEILAAFFGANTGFTAASLTPGGGTRTFNSFHAAAEEAGQSRILGGIHYQFDNQAGLATGRNIGQWVLERFTTTADTQPPTIVLEAPSGTTRGTNLMLSGRVLDNLAGVVSLEVEVNDGAFTTVPFDSLGRFTFTTNFATDGSADGLQTVGFSATDAVGNLSALQVFTFTLDTQLPTINLTGPEDNSTITADAHLTGSASGTGSALVELCYQLDSGRFIPVSFDSLTGDFDVVLASSWLGLGSHTLTVRAQDAAGHTTTVTRTLQVDSLAPFVITAVTPTPDSDEVGVTYRPQVFFSRPVNPATLTSANFYATDTTGTKVPATIVPAADGSFAWLFFTQPLAGASTITITIDGATIQAATGGTLLDVDDDGTPGGLGQYSFTTVSLAGIPGTSITGILADPGPDLKPGGLDDVRAGSDGVLMTADDVYQLPIAGARIWILGLESQAVFTDAQGRFTLTDIPAGNVKLAIDGRTATNAPAGFYFPEMVMDLNIQPGISQTVMAAMEPDPVEALDMTALGVYLPRLQSSILQTVSNTDPTLIGVSAESAPNLTPEQRQQLTLEIQPGSILGPDGQPLTNAQIGISTVPPEMVREMLPPGLLQHTFDITIQAPDAATFNTPATLTFPNVFNAVPGTQLNFLSFDHTTGRLVIEGTATVSADGLTVTTDPGTGITKPGWHGLTPPGSQIDGSTGLACAQRTAGGFDPLLEAEKIARAGANLARDIEAIVRDTVPLPTGQSALQSPLYTILHFHSIARDVTTLLNQESFRLSRLLAAERLLLEFSPERRADSIAKLISAATGIATAGDSLKAAANALAQAATVAPPCDATKTQALLAAGAAIQTATNELVDKANVQLVLLQAMLADHQILETIVTRMDISQPDLGLSQAERDELEQRASAYVQQGQMIPQGPFYLPVGSIMDALPTVIGAYTLPPASSTTRGLSPGVTSPTSVALTCPLFWVAEFAGTVLRGKTTAAGQFSFVGPANAAVQVQVYNPLSNTLGYTVVLTNGAGEATSLGLIPLVSVSGPDTDGDGLVDQAEFVIGTVATRRDTDGDGINDFAEVRQCLDPLGGRAAATGVVASLPLLGVAREIVLEGSTLSSQTQTAYVATGTYGLAIVNASQAAKPVVLSQLDLPGDAADVAVDARLGIAVVASGSGGLHFVDIANPQRPVLRLTLPYVNASQVEVLDGIAYVAVGNELRSYELNTGDQLQTLHLGNNPLVGLARDGNWFYTMDTEPALRVMELVNGVLVVRGSRDVWINDMAGGKLFVGGGIAYVPVEGSFPGGFATVDVSNPGVLGQLSGPDLTDIAGRDIAVNGSGLAVTVGSPGNLGNLLHVLDVSNPANTAAFLTQYTLPADPHSVTIGAGLAFVADGTRGLQVVNYRPFDNLGASPTVSFTTSALDLDPQAPGVQVSEGTFLRIQPTVSDDVQVRNVELLVNGSVVQNDVSFPFELSTFLPSIAANGGPTVSLRVRATDTGGNVGLSDITTLTLTPDSLAPTLLGSNITEGDRKSRYFRYVTLDFSEAMAEATLTSQTIRLLNTANPSTPIVPLNVQVRNDNRSVQLTYDTFALGNYQLIIDAPSIRDRAGNALGTTTQTRNFQVVDKTVTWTAAGSGFWDVAANWSTGVVPTVEDDVVINVPASATVTIRSGTNNVHSLVVNGKLAITGGTLAVVASSTIQNLTMSGTGILDGTGDVTVTGSFVWTGGTMQGSGNTSVAAGAAFSMPSGTLNLNRTLQNQGAATWTGGTLRFQGGTFINSGTFTATPASSAVTLMAQGSNSTTNTFNNTRAGTFIKQGPGKVAFTNSGTATVVFHNQEGQVNVTGGTLQLLNGGTHTGSFDLSSGATLELRQTHTFASSCNFTGPGSISVTTVTGSFTEVTFANATLPCALTVSAGLVRFSNNISLSNVTLLGGGLFGTGVVTVTGTLNWTGGHMESTGRTVVASTGTVNFTGNSVAPDLGGIFENQGTATWTSGNLFLSGTFINGGTFTAAGSAGTIVGTFNGNTAFLNTGLFTVQNTGVLVAHIFSAYAMAFNNQGAVHVTGGTLTLFNGGTHTGDFDLGSDATLQLQGTNTFASSCDFTGPGTISVTGGTVTFANTILACALTISAGTVNFSNSMSLSSLTLSGGYLDVTNAVTVVNLKLQGVNDSALYGGIGAVTVTGLLTWKGGGMGGTGTTVVAGTFDFPSESTGARRLSRTLDNQASATWDGTLLLNGKLVNSNSITGNVQITASSSTAEFINNNNLFCSGTFQNGSGADMVFRNEGRVYATGGSLRLLTDGDHTGCFILYPDSILELQQTQTFAQTCSFDFDGNGRVEISGGTTSFGGPTTLTNLTLSGGTLEGAGDVTVTGLLDWKGGTSTMQGGGTTIVELGANFTLTATAMNLKRTLQNRGAATWTSGALRLTNGTFINTSTFTATAAQDTTLTASGLSSSNAFVNNGTFTKQGAGTVSFTASGTNSLAFRNLDGGVTNVSAGTLRLTGSPTNDNAEIIVAPGAHLDISGTFPQGSAQLTVQLGGTATDQFGRVTVSGAATLSGLLHVQFVNGFTPQAGDGFQILTYGSHTGTFPQVDVTGLPETLLVTPQYNATDVTLLVGTALQAASIGAGGPPLTDADLEPIIVAAQNYWGKPDTLRSVRFQIADLDGTLLGLAAGDLILIDQDAAGHGWFVDATPLAHEEFELEVASNQLRAWSGAGAGKVDLLTVVLHELGHILGLDDVAPGLLPEELMTDLLAAGTRRLPSSDELARVFALGEAD